jgi:hypothetical protein
MRVGPMNALIGLHGVQGVASSNPAAPTIEKKAKAQHREMLGLLLFRAAGDCPVTASRLLSSDC